MFIWLLLYKLTDNTVESKGSLPCPGLFLEKPIVAHVVKTIQRNIENISV